MDQLASALTKRHIPIALITGYGRDGLPKTFGHTPMIGKLFNRNQLLETLCQLLGSDGAAIPFRQISN